MAEEYRVTIRLTPDLYAQLEARGSHGQPLAADPAAPPRPRRGQRQLTPRQVWALRDKHRRGVPVPALMDEYGISRATVFRYLQSDKRREPPA